MILTQEEIEKLEKNVSFGYQQNIFRKRELTNYTVRLKFNKTYITFNLEYIPIEEMVLSSNIFYKRAKIRTVEVKTSFWKKNTRVNLNNDGPWWDDIRKGSNAIWTMARNKQLKDFNDRNRELEQARKNY